MSSVNLKGDMLVVTFQYDPALVERVKSVSGRQFNAKLKHWEVPKENVLELLEAIRGTGITPHMDVVALAIKATNAVGVIQELKQNPTAYAGSLPLYDFQKIGATFLMTMPGALLADVPGLGKTIQTIAACEAQTKILILCPASLKYGWADEVKKWILQDAIVIDGNKKERERQWTDDSLTYRFTIANYELLLHDKDIIPKKWSVIVADEATRLSNPNAQTTKALKALVAGKKIALTGTPVSNSPVDLFSILDWLSLGVLGSYFQFLNTYCIREPRFNRIVGFKNLEKLEKIADRFMLRRTKAEVLKDFPPKTVEDVVFALSSEEEELYSQIRYEIMEELGDKIGDNSANLGIYPVKMLRLKQVTDDARLLFTYERRGEEGVLIKSSKLAALKDLLDPVIASGEKAIIFTQFKEMLYLLMKELEEYFPLPISGDQTSEQRKIAVDEFNKDPQFKLMIMTEAGAYGLNLQAATYVIHYDLPWSVAKLMQREDRAHRIGQDKPVTVYNLIAKDTIDEYVAKILKAKNKTAVKLLNDDDRLEDFGLSATDIKSILRI